MLNRFWPAGRGVVCACLLMLGLASELQGDVIGYRLTYRGDLIDDTNWAPLELQNLSAPGIQIESLLLTVGDAANHNWDQVVTLAASPLSATLIAPDELDDGVRSDVIQYSFGGFEAGEFFRFRADVDPDPSSNVILDFRSVLFNNGALPNAVVTVQFSNGFTLTDTLADQSFASNASADLATQVQSLTAVPEPSALVAWGIALLVGAAAIWRQHA